MKTRLLIADENREYCLRLTSYWKSAHPEDLETYVFWDLDELQLFLNNGTGDVLLLGQGMAQLIHQLNVDIPCVVFSDASMNGAKLYNMPTIGRYQSAEFILDEINQLFKASLAQKQANENIANQNKMQQPNQQPVYASNTVNGVNIPNTTPQYQTNRQPVQNIVPTVGTIKPLEEASSSFFGDPEFEPAQSSAPDPITSSLLEPVFQTVADTRTNFVDTSNERASVLGEIDSQTLSKNKEDSSPLFYQNKTGAIPSVSTNDYAENTNVNKPSWQVPLNTTSDLVNNGDESSLISNIDRQLETMNNDTQVVSNDWVNTFNKQTAPMNKATSDVTPATQQTLQNPQKPASIPAGSSVNRAPINIQKDTVPVYNTPDTVERYAKYGIQVARPMINAQPITNNASGFQGRANPKIVEKTESVKNQFTQAWRETAGSTTPTTGAKKKKASYEQVAKTSPQPAPQSVVPRGNVEQRTSNNTVSNHTKDKNVIEQVATQPQQVLAHVDKSQTIKKPDIITFVATNGGAGATTASLAAAMKQARQNKKVLYLPFTQCSNTSLILDGTGQYTIADMTREVINNNGVDMQLNNMVRLSSKGVYYMASSPYGMDVLNLTATSIVQTLEFFASLNIYDTIFVDIDNQLNDRLFATITFSDLTILVSDGSVIGNAKLNKYIYAIHFLTEQGNEKKHINLAVLYNKFVQNSYKLLDETSTAMPIVGILPIFENKQPKELVEELSTLSVFNLQY